MMQEMLNSPMVRSYMDSLAENPDMLRNMIESNPQMRVGPGRYC